MNPMDGYPPVQGGPYIDPWGEAGGIPNAPRARTPGGAPLNQVPSAGLGIAAPPNAAPVVVNQREALLNGTIVVAVTTASQKVLDQPLTSRNLLVLRNSSAAAVVIYIEFGNDATVNSTFRLAQNEVFLFDAAVPQDDIFVIGAAAGQLSISVSTISLPG